MTGAIYDRFGLQCRPHSGTTCYARQHHRARADRCYLLPQSTKAQPQAY